MSFTVLTVPVTLHLKLGPRPEGAALVPAQVWHFGGSSGRRGRRRRSFSSLRPPLRTCLSPVLRGEVPRQVGRREALERGLFGRRVVRRCGGICTTQTPISKLHPAKSGISPILNNKQVRVAHSPDDCCVEMGLDFFWCLATAARTFSFATRNFILWRWLRCA